MKKLLTLLFLISTFFATARTWVDTLDAYAREEYRPANKYSWTWQNAALLNTMVKQYYWAAEDDKQVYLDYVNTAMQNTWRKANGKTPNAVASGLGMAFLYRISKDPMLLAKCEKIFADYLGIRRTPEGAVSHLRLFTELWDDTVFMIGQYLLQMYQATGDEQYLDEFMKQFRLHHDKLRDPEVNLWVHGWDADNKGHCTFCSQNRWQDKETRRSHEYWGRGNGWIVVTLSDALGMVNTDHPYWKELAGYLTEMVQGLPELQDEATGHWYQLPVRKGEEGNYLESSCTAMFSYGIQTALKLDLLSGPQFEQAVERAYYGLRQHSLVPVGDNYLTTQNVCKGTCIGDKNYYFGRKSQQGKPYAIGMFIQFGMLYEMEHGLR